MVDIPIFPLGLVLFPNMPLELHIFEERYRTMVADCEATGQGFGIVGIRPGGAERDGAGRMYDVGTLANLRDVERLDDGRFNLTVTGATRFRIQSVRLDKPYITATVELLAESDEAPEILEPLVKRVTEIYERYFEALEVIAGRGTEGLDIPTDPELLSYLVAGTLQIETWQQQMLLDTDSVGTRLRQCLRLLRREIVFAERMLARRDPRHALASVRAN